MKYFKLRIISLVCLVMIGAMLVCSHPIDARRVRDELVHPSPVFFNPDGSFQRNVVEWLISRVEKRFGIAFNLDIKNELVSEFNKGSIFNLIANSYTSGRGVPDKGENLKELVYQEAVLLSSALPALSKNEKNIPLGVGLNRENLEQMREGRSKFLGELDTLIKEAEEFWEGQLRQYRGEVYSFNEYFLQENPKISINIVSMTRRFSLLLKRIQELKMDTERKDFELVITIADPDNLSETMISQLRQSLESADFSSKVVLAKKNTIPINRNLGSSVSCGSFIIFLDDDVRLVGPVIVRLIKTLEDYPDLGVVSIPSYDSKLKIYRPGSYHLKYAINDEVVLTNRVSGMIMATRREIVKVVPFPIFWPNFGEDLQFSVQIHNLGYLNAFIYPEDAYVIHEMVSERATVNINTFTNVLVHEGLTYYLEPPDKIDELRENLTIVRLKQYGGDKGSFNSVKEFWADFRIRVESFLNGDSEAWQEFLQNAYENEWACERLDSIEAAIKYFEENKEQIVKFKMGEYEGKRFSDVNPFLGLLEYQKRTGGDETF